MPPLEFITHSPGETRRLGESLGGLLTAGDVITLGGELGAGKTVLAQGLGQGLGIMDPVSSPTFALVQEYVGQVPVWHLDVYRLRSLDELIDLSWQDLLAGGGVVIVEWPERIETALPSERLDVRLEYVDEVSRRITLLPRGERMDGVVDRVKAETDAGSGN